MTVAATPLRDRLDAANIVMLFLLAVLIAAVRLGRGAGVLAALLSVAAFDFFFVSPRFSMAISDMQYLVTFAVMLTVALLTAHLTADLGLQAEAARQGEARMGALYWMARELSGALTPAQVEEITRHFIHQEFQAEARLLPTGTTPAPDAGEWACLPLAAPMQVRGVLAISPPPRPEHGRELETCASLVAIALERLHYVQVAQDAQIQAESERLRNTLLAALSHDLRTPLTALMGLADSLGLQQDLTPVQADLAEAIRDEALRTGTLVHNVLEMARLQTGQVVLRREWMPLEEVVGAAIQARNSRLARHRLKVELSEDLPLLELDAVWMEQVFCNLLENAAKYTPPGSCISISANQDGNQVQVRVCDDGPGLPPGETARLFDKFSRGSDESAIPGVGLGLSIVRSIVTAHGGRVSAWNQPEGGACFGFSLPTGHPPSMPPEA